MFDFCSCRSGHNGEEFDLANTALESVEEPDEKQTMMDASTADVNTYSKEKNCVQLTIQCFLDNSGEPVSLKAARDSGLLQVPRYRSRVPSYHMRELARGDFLVKNEDITLLDCIGEGRLTNCDDSLILILLTSTLGEFGIVYRARLRHSNRYVAVKTLKGSFFALTLVVPQM